MCLVSSSPIYIASSLLVLSFAQQLPIVYSILYTFKIYIMLPSTAFSCCMKIKKRGDTICYIRSIGSSFINGSCSKYDDTMPSDISNYIDDQTYDIMMDRINGVGSSYWPCGPSVLIGTVCCPFTFGLSLLIPWYVCVM